MFKQLTHYFNKLKQPTFITAAVVGICVGSFITAGIVFSWDLQMWLSVMLVTISLLLSFQGLMTLYWMIYAWDAPDITMQNKSPRNFSTPSLSFTALVPVRHEESVIEHTVQAIARINYPENLKETLIICRDDDTETITAAQIAINKLGVDNIKVLVFSGGVMAKPRHLNVGLQASSNEVITIFDAEDEPHPDIYNIINTVMVRSGADVVQSGVQLMNFRSRWFSSLNVLEYFFWFKSVLHCLSQTGVLPLAGNTVFFKSQWLYHVGGWDEQCLTEDADIGIRLSLEGAKIQVVYDEQHATQEETPPTVSQFIKQRTRWNQGFIQMFFKGEWTKLPTLKQRSLVFYMLTWPILYSLIWISLPISIFIFTKIDVPSWVAIVSNIPLYVLLLQLVVLNIGLYEFTRSYKLRYPFWMPLQLTLSFFPFLMLLWVSALRAAARSMTNSTAWEKTQHTNAHRVEVDTLDPDFIFQ